MLLPGRWDRPEKFHRSGFDRAVARRGLGLDLVAVDSRLAYFRAGTIVERLRADIVGPARAAGYERIWIVGASLGGLGGLLYLREHPEDLAGVLALAPYLGEPGRPHGHELWSWLAPWARGHHAVPLHLGWGDRDKLDAGNRMLAGLLPAERVYLSAGGHDWRTWEGIWETFLDRTDLCAEARPAQ